MFFDSSPLSPATVVTRLPMFIILVCSPPSTTVDGLKHPFFMCSATSSWRLARQTEGNIRGLVLSMCHIHVVAATCCSRLCTTTIKCCTYVRHVDWYFIFQLCLSSSFSRSCLNEAGVQQAGGLGPQGLCRHFQGGGASSSGGWVGVSHRDMISLRYATTLVYPALVSE